MKNLQSYEEFLFEQWPSFTFDGEELKVGKSVRSFDGYSGIIVSKESVNGKVQYRDHKGVVRVCESYELVDAESLNEADLTWWEVTKGILAADLIKVGIGFAGGGVLLAGYLFSHWRNKVANQLERVRSDKKYAALKAQANKIAEKFNGDSELTDMLGELEKYPYVDPTYAKGKRGVDAAKKQNNERKRIMREIAKYVKSKLTPEELPFFQEVNAILRSQPLSDNEGKSLEEDVVSDPNRMVGTGTLTPVSPADQNFGVQGGRNTDDAIGVDTLART
jgi:hypothetical protein